MRIPAALAVAAIALGPAATAAAAGRPLVPSAAQARITAAAPTLAYVPTRLGFGYRYARWARSPGTVRIWFRSRAGKQILFTAAPLVGGCRAGFEKSFQLAGNKVYWAGTPGPQHAWRCVTGPTGRPVRLSVSTTQPPTRFADVGLGRVAASARRIAWGGRSRE